MTKSQNESSAIKRPPSSRIIALDYLRGFFITIIIVDHIWRWPNLFQFISGRGELWVSAAEGFVIISGLLVGYVHGYKKRNLPLKGITFKLFKRAIMLYIWMFITTVAVVAASWLVNSRGPVGYIPVPQNDWGALFMAMLKLDYVHSLTHFLYLYAAYLIMSPGAIWLLRRGKDWIVILASVIVWGIGVYGSVEWMQWQILFFIAAVIGYHFDSLIAKYRALKPKAKLTLRLSTAGIMLASFAYSLSQVLPHPAGHYSNDFFGREPLTIMTIIMSFVWFAGLLSIFQYLLPLLKKWLGWLLLTFGERSLTGYILHVVPVILAQWFIAASDNFFINTLVVASAILLTWALLRIPGINKFIPR